MSKNKHCELHVHHYKGMNHLYIAEQQCFPLEQLILKFCCYLIIFIAWWPLKIVIQTNYSWFLMPCYQQLKRLAMAECSSRHFVVFFGGFFFGWGGREVFMVILRWKFEIFRNPHPTPDPSRSAHAQFEKLCLIRSSTAPWQQNMFKPQTSVIAIKHDMKCLIWHI